MVDWRLFVRICDRADDVERNKFCKEEYVVNEVGWIIFEDDNFIVVTSQVSDDGDIGNRTKIPKSWVKKRIKITEPKRRKS